MAAESVHLIGIYLSEFRMLYYGIFLQCSFYLCSERSAFCGEVFTSVDCREDLCGLAE